MPYALGHVHDHDQRSQDSDLRVRYGGRVGETGALRVYANGYRRGELLRADGEGARDGWDGVLRYHEGEAYRLRNEAGDEERATGAYSQAVQDATCPAEAHRAHGYALLKAGSKADGLRSLARYLELRPNAPDAAMVQFSINQ